MSKQKLYTFEDDLKYRLKDPEFKKLWKTFDPEYQTTRQLLDLMRITKQEIATPRLAGLAMT